MQTMFHDGPDTVSAESGSEPVMLQLNTPARWPTPKRGMEASTWLRITIRNLGPPTIRFFLVDTLRFSLSRSDDGGSAPMQHGRDALRRAPTLTEPVPAGSAHVVDRGVVVTQQGPTLLVRIDDGFGGWWWTRTKPPGLLRLSVSMNHRADPPASHVAEFPVWSGHIRGPTVSVLI